MSQYWKQFFRQSVRVAGDDPCCQVARTLNKQPMSRAMFSAMASRLIAHLELRAEQVILDLCCGNGLLSAEIAPLCKRVVGVDFSEDLVAAMRAQSPANICGVVADGTTVAFPPASFDRIVIAAALQHFSHAEVIDLFKRLAAWLKPEGILLLADVPDAERIWQYFDSKEREDVYFQNIVAETPVLGSWFDRLWLQKLSRHAGFARTRVVEQPEDYWYSHYRFDFLAHK